MDYKNKGCPYKTRTSLFLFIVLFYGAFSLIRYSAICTAFSAAPFLIWSPNPERQSVFVAGGPCGYGLRKPGLCPRGTTAWGILSFPVVHQHQSVAFGNASASFFDGDGTPGFYPDAFGVGAESGTRTQVALTFTSECIILRVSLNIFISSLV